MLIAGINGSPNVQGNTGTLISRVLAGAAEGGGETMAFNLGLMKISPCRACMACKDNKPCVNLDEMGDFYARAPEIDRLVIGTPIYLDHISAQLKIFFDRLYCYLGSGMEKYWPGGRQAVIGITYGDGDPNLYNHVLDWIKERLSFYFGIETVGMLKKAGCPESVIVDQDEALMEEALELGRRLGT